jgi:hypothetical protein
MVRVYTQNPNVVYEAEKNGRFSLFDGNITGCFSSFVNLVYSKYYKNYSSTYF